MSEKIDKKALEQALKDEIRRQLISKLNERFKILLKDEGNKIYIEDLDILYKKIPEILGYLISELSQAIYQYHKPENLSS